jgi:hypothetical protein
LPLEKQADTLLLSGSPSLGSWRLKNKTNISNKHPFVRLSKSSQSILHSHPFHDVQDVSIQFMHACVHMMKIISLEVA